MNCARWIVAVMAVAGSLVGPTMSAEDTGVAAVEAAWVKAIKANSLDQVMALYADDAVGWFPDMSEASGAKAIRASYENLLSTFTIKDASLTGTHSKNAGKLSLGWGKFTLTVVEKATGKEQVWNGRFTDVAERRRGRWLYIVDHASAEPLPPPAAAPTK